METSAFSRANGAAVSAQRQNFYYRLYASPIHFPKNKSGIGLGNARPSGYYQRMAFILFGGEEGIRVRSLDDIETV